MSKKLVNILFPVLLTLLPVTVSAAQNKTAEDGDEITADISRSDINRIKLIGDRIRSVKANNGELELSQDDKLGEIYVRPTNLAEKKPINLFVMTEQNFTYKLLLFPKSIPSEQILIHNELVVNNTDLDVSKNTRSGYQQQIIALMKAMHHHKKINGYEIKVAKKKIDLGNNLEIKRISTYRNANFFGEIYLVKNDGDQIVNLEENVFYRNGVRAVKIENPNLLPGDVTEILIVS